jgi:hypothetical protein
MDMTDPPEKFPSYEPPAPANPKGVVYAPPGFHKPLYKLARMLGKVRKNNQAPIRRKKKVRIE